MLPLLEAEAKERQRLSGGDRKSDAYKKSVPAQTEEPIRREGEAAVQAELTGFERGRFFICQFYVN